MIRPFLKDLLIFLIPILLVLAISTVLLQRAFPHITHPNQTLIHYQQQKIQTHPPYTILFIGDSALGNAIDVALFSENTKHTAINVALTAYSGYASSYNMLKAAHRQNPQLQTIILMQSIKVPTYPTSYIGYRHTRPQGNNDTTLSWRDRLHIAIAPLQHTPKVIKHLLATLIRGPQDPRPIRIQNDYIQQGALYRPHTPPPGLHPHDIQTQQFHFLKKIVQYATQNQLQIHYIHGPFWDAIVHASTDYIQAINQHITETGIPFIPDVMAVPIDDIGDRPSHIKSEKKADYTLRYQDWIEAHVLKKGNKK